MKNMGRLKRIETGTLEEPSLEEGAVVATEENAWLVVDVDYVDGAELLLDEIDAEPGRVRLHFPTATDEDEIEFVDQKYDALRDARLAFGLWQACGPFDEPEGGAIPVEVATAGRPYIAAYMRTTMERSRESIAKQMDVNADTVSDYWSRVRWTPDNTVEL